MQSNEILDRAFEQVRDTAHRTVRGLSEDQLAAQPDGRGNSIAWLVWHLARVQDDHVAEASGGEQAWLAGGWRERFALPLEAADTGYGHDADQVRAVRTTAELLSGYLDAVHERTAGLVSGLTDADLDRVVDDSYDPPVSLGVRLVSVLADDLQHLGQAAYVRGLL